MTPLERKELARNIRHRLADMFGSKWNGALDAAMDEMLLDEIDKVCGTEVPVDGAKLGDYLQELYDRKPDDCDPDPDAGEYGDPYLNGDPYLKGIMEKD